MIFSVSRWYDLAERVGESFDERPESVVEEEYLALMKESVGLRFRADVPIGINLSGGLDSSSLLALVHAVQGADSDVKAFTFTTGDENYDELPWVEKMLEKTRHPLCVSRLGGAGRAGIGCLRPISSGRTVWRHSNARLRPTF